MDPADLFSQFFGGAFGKRGPGMQGGMGTMGQDIEV
jgi:hypothetical protein